LVVEFNWVSVAACGQEGVRGGLSEIGKPTLRGGSPGHIPGPQLCVGRKLDSPDHSSGQNGGGGDGASSLSSPSDAIPAEARAKDRPAALAAVFPASELERKANGVDGVVVPPRTGGRMGSNATLG
jgi:hypothetical protein